MRSLEINIVCGLNGDINLRQIELINQISSYFYKYKVVVYMPNVISNIFFKDNIIVRSIFMNADLFDFSRYDSGIKAVKNEWSPILCFNDTLGNGRKLNKPLVYFIIKSIELCIKSVNSFAAPFDRDEYGEWICPYFFISTKLVLKELNFTNFEKARKMITRHQYYKIIEWIDSGWRNSSLSTKNQKDIKLKTLILERALLHSIEKSTKIKKFNKYSLYRILNSLT